MGPQIKGNPIKIFVYLLVISYVVGEFIIPKYPIIYLSYWETNCDYLLRRMTSV